jgi:hypothetical protein
LKMDQLILFLIIKMNKSMFYIILQKDNVLELKDSFQEAHKNSLQKATVSRLYLKF